MPVTYRLNLDQLTEAHSTAIKAYVDTTPIDRFPLISGPVSVKFLKTAASGNTDKMMEHIHILIGNPGASMRSSATDVASNGFIHRIDFIAAVIQSIESDEEQFILTLNDELIANPGLTPDESEVAFRSKALNFRLDLIRKAHLTLPMAATAQPIYTAPPMPEPAAVQPTFFAYGYPAGIMVAQLGQPIDSTTVPRRLLPQ